MGDLERGLRPLDPPQKEKPKTALDAYRKEFSDVEGAPEGIWELALQVRGFGGSAPSEGAGDRPPLKVWGQSPPPPQR